jgi:putative transposase
MNTRKAAGEYRLASWGQALAERAANKESIKAFCERKGVSKNTYFYWQRKLREAAINELLPAAKESKDEKGIVPQGWAICEEEKSAPAKKGIVIEIGKCRVRAESGSDLEELESVIRMLVRIC